MVTNFLIILITGTLIGATSSYLGSLMLSRKMTIVVDPLSHLALPGVALALALGRDISLGAFLFLFFGTILIWFLEQKTKLPIETIIAVLFSTSLAATFLFLEEEELHEALLGDISKIGMAGVIIIVLVCTLVFFLIQRFYRKLLLISASEDLARAEKIEIKKYQFLYLILISIIVALGVKFVGGLLVAGLTALPPASAKNLAKNLKTYRFLSSLFGALSVVLGTLLFQITKFPLGPLIVLSSFLVFLISIILKFR